MNQDQGWLASIYILIMKSGHAAKVLWSRQNSLSQKYHKSQNLVKLGAFLSRLQLLMKHIYFYLLTGLIFISCADDRDDYDVAQSALDLRLEELLEQAAGGQGKEFFILPESDDYASIPQDPLNPLTASKVELGMFLLHETAMGGSPKMIQMQGTYSCASCHPVASSFYSGRRQGIGECGTGFGSVGESRQLNLNVPLDSIDIQPIRVPTLLNVAYQDVALWNGMLGGTGTNIGTESQWTAAGVPENNLGFQGLEIQGIVGQQTHRLKVDEDFVNNNGYRQLFDQAFPALAPSDRYTTQSAALAIAAFNRTLLSNDAPWQAYLKGDYRALTDQEKRGAIVFAGKGECINCHTGPALKDQDFHAFGFGHFDDSQDAVVLDDGGFDAVRRGRGGFTGNSADDYKFKTPTLYNLRDAAFYGHGGTFNSIAEVVRYKNANDLQDPAARANLASEMGNINLTFQEMEDLTQFLEFALYDSTLDRYVPESVKSGNCFPNADVQSRLDLGCN
ncbi:cytochrome-c peroxidase [Nonlabens xiamenensis]|uniref:cytochrome-c peroxidase n=1 Tax=Nonlabens xiamenensis TaxID=2341043 RepID=UPI001F0C2529|nr:cytochrome c peroxidase [Nonlabens xiamenensis]